MILKKGNISNNVKKLQTHLNVLLNDTLVVDGHFGSITERSVNNFHKKYGLNVDNIITLNEIKLIESLVSKKFIIPVGAGHGGVDEDDNYMTPESIGKKYRHGSTGMHDGKGEFREGVENRIVANLFIKELNIINPEISYIKIYDEVYDTPLGYRTKKIANLAKSGYFGYLHSFHSNAADLYVRNRKTRSIIRRRTKQELDDIIGFCVFTSRGQNVSDIIADFYYDIIEEEFGAEWKMRPNTYIDGDKDWEADFHMLKYTDLKQASPKFGAILEEFGFYTSEEDANFIMNARSRRAKCAAKLANKVFNFMTKYEL